MFRPLSKRKKVLIWIQILILNLVSRVVYVNYTSQRVIRKSLRQQIPVLSSLPQGHMILHNVVN